MNIIPFIIVIGWIALGVYWVKSAIGSKKITLSGARQHTRIRLGILIFMAVLIVLFRAVDVPRRFDVFLSASLTPFVGLLLFIAGVLLAVWARKTMGANWGMPMAKNDEAQLVTDGPYRFIRHPIYAAYLLLTLGSSLAMSVYWLIPFIAGGAFFIFIIAIEERMMMKRFPKEYGAYRRHTKRLIPFVF